MNRCMHGWGKLAFSKRLLSGLEERLKGKVVCADVFNLYSSYIVISFPGGRAELHRAVR